MKPRSPTHHIGIPFEPKQEMPSHAVRPESFLDSETAIRWHKVVISKSDHKTFRHSVVALKDHFAQAYRVEFCPDDFEIWCGRESPRNFVFFLSPAASRAVFPLPMGIKAGQCAEPDFGWLARVEL